MHSKCLEAFSAISWLPAANTRRAIKSIGPPKTKQPCVALRHLLKCSHFHFKQDETLKATFLHIENSWWCRVKEEKPVVSIRELKQWNCTKISITSRKVCSWTGKTFWVNILRSLNQVREPIYTSMGLTCIETTGNRTQPKTFKN